MKRVISALAIFIFPLLMLQTGCAREIDSYSLSDYARQIAWYPSDLIVSPIENARDAKEKAEEIWIDEFGTRVKRKKPYKAYFDSTSKTWFVTGTMHLQFLPIRGGAPNIVFQEDGKVLAVWHDM